MSKNKISNISIVGLGGVGGYYGGLLARRANLTKDFKVNFIARGEHYKKIEKQGLILNTAKDNFQIKPTKIFDDLSKINESDLIIIAVKSYSFNDLIDQLAPKIKRETFVLPLLNGVHFSEIVENKIPQAISLKACVYISAKMIEPGLIQHSCGSCKLLFGKSNIQQDSLQLVKNILVESNIKAEYIQDIDSIVWQKYLYVCPVACITAAYQQSKGEILKNQKYFMELKGLMEEIKLIAKFKGINLPENIVEQSLSIFKEFSPNSYSSFYHDLNENKPCEFDIFPEYLIHLSNAYQIETPYLFKFYNILKDQLKISSNSLNI